MAARGHARTSHGRRPTQASGLLHVPLVAVSHIELLENKFVTQRAERDRLAGENHRLAAIQVALRENLLKAQQKAQRLNSQITSIDTESNIQIRVLLDKIAKLEEDIRAGEAVRNDLQLAGQEAQSLAASRQELIVQIQQANQELKEAQNDAKELPELYAQLNGLVREHSRLRVAFEYEKGLNMDLVLELQAMETKMIKMAREVEKLRAEVVAADRRVFAQNSHGAGFASPNLSYGGHKEDTVHYMDGYGRSMDHLPVGEGQVPYGGGNTPGVSSGDVSLPNTSSGPGVGSAYDSSLPRRWN